jgi:hypothetical protein
MRVHFSLLLFWIIYAVFLQLRGSLWDGQGKSFSESLRSLIEMLTGFSTNKELLIILLCFIILLFATIIKNFKKIKASFLHIFTPSIFYYLLILSSLVTFWSMKVFLHINYPQDRTALFFYIFFIVAAAFTFDLFTGIAVKTLSFLVVTGAIFHFMTHINFSHSLGMYKTIPENFYTQLLKEQQLNPEKITISGPMKDSYDFLNYRHGGTLNRLDEPDIMQMNCDYVIGWKALEQYYKPFYDEIDSENDWGMTLLKRKEKIKRNVLFSIDSSRQIDGKEEYFNLYLTKDTCFKSTNPLLVEFNIGWIKSRMPLQAWLVFEIDSSEGQIAYYKYIPLNHIKYNWNNFKDQRLYIVTGPLPHKIHRIISYLWNLEEKKVKLKINYIKFYQIEGNGVNIITSYPDYFHY